MKSKTELVFYFDYISPNAYLAWSQLPKLIDKHSLTLKIAPVLFAGLLKAHNQMGPVEQPAKGLWMAKNIARKTSLLDIPLSPAKHHPYNPLLSLRLSSLDMEQERKCALVDSFMRGIWVDSLHPSDESDVRLILEREGFDADDLLARANSSETAQKLKEQTSTAVAKGVFGVPSMLCQDELFFGFDDFVYLDLMLSGQDPLVHSQQAKKWIHTHPTPSAIRKEARQS